MTENAVKHGGQTEEEMRRDEGKNKRSGWTELKRKRGAC
jgi:hypothetical protein